MKNVKLALLIPNLMVVQIQASKTLNDLINESLVTFSSVQSKSLETLLIQIRIAAMQFKEVLDEYGNFLINLGLSFANLTIEFDIENENIIYKSLMSFQEKMLYSSIMLKQNFFLVRDMILVNKNHNEKILANLSKDKNYTIQKDIFCEEDLAINNINKTYIPNKNLSNNQRNIN